MTPSEQWILGLFAVYSIPAFLSGVGMTLAFVRWRRRSTTTAPGLLSPERTFERHAVRLPDKSPGLLLNGLRLR